MNQPMDDDCERLDMRNRLVIIRSCFANATADIESMLHVLDVTHPDDERPRRAVEAARVLDETLERYLGWQIDWRAVDERVEALAQAADEVSMHTMLHVKTERVFSAADAICHAARAIGNAGRHDACSAIRDAACAAGAVAVCRKIAETGEALGEDGIRAVMDEVYDVKSAELHQAVAQLLASQG